MKQIKLPFLIITMTFMIPFTISASYLENGVQCDKQNEETEICRFNLTTYDSASVDYKYEIRRAKPGSPTLIAIPGGPGQGLIGSMGLVKYSDHVPEDFGIILIDPRGVGQNNFGPDPSGDIYTTENVAADILQIIKREELDNYYIHGQSYGTVVATVLGSQLSSESLVKPKGIILSGIVNEKFEDTLSGYNQQLARLYSYFTPTQQQTILKNLKILSDEFGENQRIFSILFINVLNPNIEDSTSTGQNSVNMKRFFELLAEDRIDSTNQAIRFFQDTAKAVGKIKKTVAVIRQDTMPEIIKCRELTGNDGMVDLIFDFAQFKLISNYSDCRQKGYQLDRPYDSINYQVTNIPLYYVQGLLDPATPLKGAYAHFASQQSSSKIFVQLDHHAHTGLIGLWPCQAGLWKSLEGGISSFRELILKCNQENIKILD